MPSFSLNSTRTESVELSNQPSWVMTSAGNSCRGGRKKNEDRFYRDDENQCYMVIDGMGGHCGGSLASQIAVETISASLAQMVADLDSDKEIEVAFRSVLNDACLEMADVAAVYPEFSKMGCTLSLAFFATGKLFFSNVGDCRLYLYRQGDLSLLTHDETVVQELIDENVISEIEGLTHRWRHLVTNSANARGFSKKPMLHSIRIVAGDRLVLMSDGLSNELPDDEIANQIQVAETPDDCINNLIDTALVGGAKDNVTCVVVEVSSPADAD